MVSILLPRDTGVRPLSSWELDTGCRVRMAEGRGWVGRGGPLVTTGAALRLDTWPGVRRTIEGGEVSDVTRPDVTRLGLLTCDRGTGTRVFLFSSSGLTVII